MGDTVDFHFGCHPSHNYATDCKTLASQAMKLLWYSSYQIKIRNFGMYFIVIQTILEEDKIGS